MIIFLVIAIFGILAANIVFFNTQSVIWGVATYLAITAIAVIVLFYGELI